MQSKSMIRKQEIIDKNKFNRDQVILLLTKKKVYASADDIAKACGISKPAAYTLVRKMRLEGYPIQPAKGGYVHAKNATMRDDVHFIRKVIGTQTSQRIMINNCLPFISLRWEKNEDKSTLLALTSPFTSGNALFSKSKLALENLPDKL